MLRSIDACAKQQLLLPMLPADVHGLHVDDTLVVVSVQTG